MKIVLKEEEPRGLSSSETERLVKEMSQAPERQKEGTFEENSRRMAEALKANTLDACRANAEDPLHAAFTAKAVVHSGPGGMPLMGPDAERTLDGLLDTPRKGKTLAYLHVPFCETRCLYCLFYQNPYKEEAVSRYAEALVKEIQLWSDRAAVTSHPVHAVYFGGGTPTAFSPDDLKLVIGAVKKYLPLANDCEITVEGRIHGFTDEKIEAALEAGANRFSLGVQTFNTDVRRSMMRVDDRDTILARLDKLCSYDNSSVVMDLIYGFPGQTMDVWEDDVKTAASLPLDGIDCYQLNVFERSPLAKYVANGKLPPAADTAQKADMFAMSVELLTNAHWRRLSNNHWGNGTRERNIYNALGKGASDCLAFGCGAGGRLHGHSFMMERKLDAWYAQLEAGKKPVGMLMSPTPHWHLLRTISSEMESGSIDLTAIARKFNVPVDKLAAPVINQWVEAGLLVPVGNGFVQTVAGQYWHVTLAQLLVNWLTQQLMPAEARAGHRIHPDAMMAARGMGHPKAAHPAMEGADPAEIARKMHAAHSHAA